MAVQQRRVSKTRKRLRRTHFKLVKPTFVICSQCKKNIPSHCICPYCGYYKGKKILNIVGKSNKEKFK